MSTITLVLLPGMDGTGQLFAPLINEIGAFCRVQVVRYPVDSVAGYRELIEYARAELPTDCDYILLGESFSGPIAVALAAESPRGLKGLILGCSFVRSPQPGLGLSASLARFVPMRLATAMPVMQMLLGKYATPSLCRMLQAAIRSVRTSALLARLRAIAVVNVEADIARIDVPIMYLQATNDMLVPDSVARAMCRIQPAIKLVRLDGPHFLLQTNPRQVAHSISQFARELSLAN